MTTLSRAELEKLASDAGFKGDDIKIAAAVAIAESGGDPRSHNSTPPDDSYGLWQINMLGKLGPARRAVFKISSNEQLYDPATNARAAHIVWNGSGWNAWTTYTSKKYKDHLDPTTVNDSSTTGGSTASAPQSVGDSIKSGINSLGKNLFNGVADVGGLLVGLVLLILGVVLLARAQVSNILPATKVVKAVKAVSR